MINMDLSGMKPEVPPSTIVEDTLGLNLRGVLEQLLWGSPAAPCSPSKHITSRIQLPSAALGAPCKLRKQKILPGLWEQSSLSLPQC